MLSNRLILLSNRNINSLVKTSITSSSSCYYNNYNVVGIGRYYPNHQLLYPSGTTRYYSTNNNNNNNQNNNQNNSNNNSNGGEKKKNKYNKYLLLGAAGFIVPLCFFIPVDSGDNRTGNETNEAKPILLSQTINVQKIYANKSLSDLLFSYFILQLCSINYLSENGQSLLHFAEKYGLSKPMNWIVKHTFFRQFCAGETIEETDYFTQKLNQQGIGTILDYSVEDKEGTASSFNHVADQIIKTIHLAAKYPKLSFSCVKVTGLTSPSLLEKLNIIASAKNQGQTPTLDSLKNPKQFYRDGVKGGVTLTDQEKREMEELVDRLDTIFQQCHEKNIPILVDAEQTWYQQAIHHLTISFAFKYNKEKPLIYNTYQMYLSSGINLLDDHLSTAKKQGFKLGAKIVRGAYMTSERAKAAQGGLASPILPNIEETHHSYNMAMEMLLRELSRDGNALGLMIASHNEASVSQGSHRIKQLQIDGSNNPNIQFGQLFGMADYLTLGLVNQNQRVFKYVPYGPVQDVLPYLIRRMQENKGFIGSNSATELSFLKKEIKRRLNPFE